MYGLKPVPFILTHYQGDSQLCLLRVLRMNLIEGLLEIGKQHGLLAIGPG
jgi:hypothetical protein